MRMAVARKQKRPRSRQWPQRPENGDSLGREGNEVIAVRFFLSIEVPLHSCGRDAPQWRPSVEIPELGPFGAAQFAGANRGQRKQAQRQSCHRAGIILLRRDDHLLERGEIGDRRLATLSKWFQYGTQPFGGIVPHYALAIP
ncbi:hypothetical protein [Sphingomonas gei]|uniref:hypothetical protein n=1 Tax=Sphingomonas gei TaxID=1395960 RepID=UPI001F0E2CDC|nr:hypothetical protein [Sphingomonas gei]